MATQRLIVATIGGAAAVAVEAVWRNWQCDTTRNPAAVDQFCTRLRANAESLPVLYYCEWLDKWLVGNLVPGPGAVEGKRYQLTCMSADQACAWADQCGAQWPEQQWLATRLREAAAAGWELTKPLIVAVMREVLGGSATDEEICAALGNVPQWLAEQGKDRSRCDREDIA
jgi:hypothetical protein